jgi:basic membrane protein A and related proteins
MQLQKLCCFLALLAAVCAAGARAQTFGIVTNSGGTVTDGTFNQFAYEGALRAADAVGGTVLVRESVTEDDYVPFIEELAAAQVDCIVTVGFLLADVTAQQSAALPAQLFAIVDVSYNPELPNVAGVVFREDQAGYLTGVIAGLVSQSKVVACIGGPEFIPPIPKVRSR